MNCTDVDEKEESVAPANAGPDRGIDAVVRLAEVRNRWNCKTKFALENLAKTIVGMQLTGTTTAPEETTDREPSIEPSGLDDGGRLLASSSALSSSAQEQDTVSSSSLSAAWSPSQGNRV